MAQHKFHAVVNGFTWRALVSMTLLAGIVINVMASSQSDGTTPLALLAGAPAGSYSFSDLEHMNPFNGDLTLTVPLLAVGGRGTAQYKMTLAIENKFVLEHGPNGDFPYRSNSATGYYPNRPFPLYEPGVLYGRQENIYDNGSCSIPNCSPWFGGSLTRLTFVMGDGTEYQLIDTITGGKPHAGFFFSFSQPAFQRGTVFTTADGASATFISDAQIADVALPSGSYNITYPSGYLMLRDGTRYQINRGKVDWIRDRNGNKLLFEHEPAQTQYQWESLGRLTRVTDSLGRVVQITYDVSDVAPYGLCDQISYTGFGGAPRVVRVAKAPLSTVLRQGYTFHDLQQLFPQLVVLPSGPDPRTSDDPNVFSAVWLPDGIHSYKFRYNDYCDLARVELPTGGAFEYDVRSGLNNAPDDSGVIKQQIYRRLVERRVYVDSDAIPESKTTFSRPDTQAGTSFTSVNYVDADQWKPVNGGPDERIARERHYYYANALLPLTQHVTGANWKQTRYPSWKDGKEFQTDILAADGATLLRRTTYNWQQPTAAGWWAGPHQSPNPAGGAQWFWMNPQFVSWTGSAETSPTNNPHITETSVTLADTNQVSKQTFLYDQYNNRTDTYEYDFGSGTAGGLVRHTHTDYANSTNLINGLDYTTSDATTGVRLLSLPFQQKVFDGNGNLRAQTVFEYDNYNQTSSDVFHYPLTPRSNISGLDSSFTATYYKRGNVTKTTRYLLDSNGNAIGSFSGYAQYDIAGNAVKAIDPRSTTSNIIATSFEFTDRFGSPDTEAQSNFPPSTPPSELGTLMSYAFPTKVTNSQGHIAYTQYDYYLGVPVNTEDANGVVSSTEYGNGGLDLRDRPSRVVRAINDTSVNSVKSQMTIGYDDVNRVVTTTSDFNNFNDTNPLKSQTLYDGLGRTIESRTYEGGSNYIAAKTQFDALGRAYKSSNPFRPWQNDTPIWTTAEFDALGRVTTVTTPDSAVVTTSYSGNTVTVTDQAGKQRKSVTDGLGRLVQVYEAPNDSNYNHLTNYSYDALDDLTGVSQGSQPPRTFVYDSLKRLLSAMNPESGTISYQYDNNGNLTQKTDPRLLSDNQTHVTVTYDYDGLNRIKTRTYNDGTPNVTFSYDATTVANSKGRLTAVSSSVSSYTYSEYDALGRVKSGTQSTDGQSYAMSYSYDLAGNLKSQTYPSGRVVVTDLDSGGRIAAIRNQTAAPTYFAGNASNPIQYSAHGAMSQLLLGNGLWEHANFNSRLQPTQIALGTSPTDSGKLRLDYTYGVLVNSVLDTSKNNGNLQSQTITAPSLTLTQSYEYDVLNRLASATEMNGTSQSWKQTFSYDRFGNRRFDASQTTIPQISPQNENATNPSISDINNRISAAGYRYDSAGNLECDPDHPCGATSPFPAYYTYNAENRINTAASSGGAIYAYDGDGRRVRKVVGTNTTTFVYNVVGQLIAEYANTAPSSWAGTSYLTTDLLGTPRAVTKADGSVTSRHDYLPFGEEISTSVGGRSGIPGYGVDEGVRQKFTLKERDNETGLDYFGARYYASMQGRFTSVDPSRKSVEVNNPQSWNRYSYALNNPLAYVDKNGKWPTWIHELIIDRAFRGLSAAQRQEIKNGSWSVDDPKRGGQNTSHANEHGMTKPGQSPEDAAEKADQFINDNVDKAKWNKEHHGLNSSLYDFGRAFHTVSDMTSPAHEGYQTWHLSGAASHAWNEYGIDSYRMGLAVGATMSLYRYTYDQKELETAVGYTPGSSDDPTVKQIRESDSFPGVEPSREAEDLYEYRLGLADGLNFDWGRQRGLRR